MPNILEHLRFMPHNKETRDIAKHLKTENHRNAMEALQRNFAIVAVGSRVLAEDPAYDEKARALLFKSLKHSPKGPFESTTGFLQDTNTNNDRMRMTHWELDYFVKIFQNPKIAEIRPLIIIDLKENKNPFDHVTKEIERFDADAKPHPLVLIRNYEPDVLQRIDPFGAFDTYLLSLSSTRGVSMGIHGQGHLTTTGQNIGLVEKTKRNSCFITLEAEGNFDATPFQRAA